MSTFGYDEQEAKLVLQFIAEENEDDIFVYAKELLDHGAKPYVKLVMTRNGPELLVSFEKPKSKEPELSNDEQA